jgi:inosine triphosphate pyrophosphatase
MQAIIFITGNQKKADYLGKYLGFPIQHIKVDLDELQSLDLREIVEHKVRQAYAKVGKPVLVDDVSLEFCALGRLPGTFIRFFLEEMLDYQQICDLLR